MASTAEATPDLRSELRLPPGRLFVDGVPAASYGRTIEAVIRFS